MSELDLSAPDDKSLDLAPTRALLGEKLAPALSGKRFAAIMDVSSDLTNEQLGEFACVLMEIGSNMEIVTELQSRIRTSHVNRVNRVNRVDRVDRTVAGETLDGVLRKFVGLLTEHSANPQNPFA